MTCQEQLQGYGVRIERALEHYLADPSEKFYPVIFESMRYVLLGGGKRLRPALVLAFCEACGGDTSKAMPVACALEMIHNYSLVHDDLPCMDDDDLRRGRPTCHKVYGEAIAVLTGDALLNRAFETVHTHALAMGLPVETVLQAAAMLSGASGVCGMIGGQVLDMQAEGVEIPLETLRMLQQRKTGALIMTACELGCLLAEGATPAYKRAAQIYGESVGLAFQIQDDLLDIEGDEAVFGKPIGSDAANHKTTFPSVLGVKACHEMVENLTNTAMQAVEVLPNHAFLQGLAQSLIHRKM